jgi:hypothetical protein
MAMAFDSFLPVPETILHLKFAELPKASRLTRLVHTIGVRILSDLQWRKLGESR